ncbi:MAG: hypothetical protein J5367_02245 [Lachnospiraceae bacterium]|nr:hypothetical protein [Lachnospiraceae bacterium]
MGRNSRKIIISVVLISAFILCACKEERVEKSSFGQVDALTDGDILVDDVEGGDEDTDAETEEALTNDIPVKTSTQLDVDSLPDNVMRMVGLCDAINMACVEMQSAYDFKNNEFVWHCVHLYIDNCDDEKIDISRAGTTYIADPRTVSNIIYSMFGKLTEIPQIAESAFGDENTDAHIRITTDLKYQFTSGDRGTSEPQVVSATQYSDGSMEMKVALVDSVTGEEMVSFIYTMRANTRDTTTGALFDFEITDSRPGDRATSDRIDGMPYLTTVMQVYGYDSYDKEDPKYADVEEVLYFGSFKEHVPGVDELNASISHEILEYANTPLDDGSWHLICSYPLTTDDYVQVATTFATYPADTSDPDIRCYGYDKKKTRALEPSDALAIMDTTDAELTAHIEELYAGMTDEEVTPALDYRGFIIRRDGSVDMFYMAGDGRLIAYNSGSDRIRYVFDEEDVIPEDETDDMKPELTHGRKGN